MTALTPDVTRDAAWRAFVGRMQEKLANHVLDETAWEHMREAFVEAYETGFRDGAEHLTESWARLGP